MCRIKQRMRFYPEVFLVAAIGILNHVLTLMAFDWYAGRDAYSYDAAGLQIMTGYVFDPFCLMFRAPLLPVIKNVLYLVFEHHVFLLGVFLHMLGVGTILLVYRLGLFFGRGIGFVLGLMAAAYLPLSVHFHHLSITTVYIPLLTVTAVFFIRWIRSPGAGNLAGLTALTILCCLTRQESVLLIPVFWIFGYAGHRIWKQANLYLILSIAVYNAVCLVYFLSFGFWGVAQSTGLNLFFRVAYGEDRIFSADNGPACAEIQRYLDSGLFRKVADQDYRAAVIGAYTAVGHDRGLYAANDLFLKAGLESWAAHPRQFLKFTGLRMLGQLGVYEPGLMTDESGYTTPTGHMWGFSEQEMRDRREYLAQWLPAPAADVSPLAWERSVLKARFLRIFNKDIRVPPLPRSFQLETNMSLNENGAAFIRFGEDGITGERLMTSHALAGYYFFGYWGSRPGSGSALKLLALWDRMIPNSSFGIVLNRIMWFLWIIGIIMLRARWKKAALSAFLLFVVLFACLQAVFSDNYGGRYFLYTCCFLWLGAVCGARALAQAAVGFFRTGTDGTRT